MYSFTIFITNVSRLFFKTLHFDFLMLEAECVCVCVCNTYIYIYEDGMHSS